MGEERAGSQHSSNEALEEWSKRFEFALNALGTAIANPLRLNEALGRTLSEVLHWTGFEAGQVLLRPNRARRLTPVASRGLKRPLSHNACWVEGEGCSRGIWSKALVQEVSAHSGGTSWLFEERGYRTLLTIPIRHRHRTYGVVALLSRKREQVSAGQLALLGSLGQQIGIAVEHARVHDQIRSAAAREERARLSWEMHDNTAQDLNLLYLKLAALEDSTLSGDTPGVASEVQELVEICSKACDDFRESILSLRFAACPFGSLVSELRNYVERLNSETDIAASARLDEDNGLALPHEAEVQLLGIIQEALTNVRRHSHATEVFVGLTHENDLIVLTIADNGRGFDVSSVAADGRTHFGLKTMADRANSVGGTLKVESSVGAGTKLTVKVPGIGRRMP
jgi:two-component system nitrate/nitrite sensor histidine kinase NarX